jgi:two-component system nitrogen regulation response regulator GlnG
MSGRPPSTLDEDTREPLPRSERGAPLRVPVITIVAHPDLSRVGARAAPMGLMMGQRVSVSRSAPLFQPTAGSAEPLGDPFVSRKSVALSFAQGTLCIDASGVTSSVSVDGQPLQGQMQLDRERVEQGVLLDLAERVLLLIHLAVPGDVPAEKYGLAGGSDAVRRLHSQIELASAHCRPVLVLGESGSGKELVARAIHASSARAGGPFVAVNMAAIPASTAAAELFGHVRGAFTGALSSNAGLFRQAHGGTLLLDEIGETSLELQAMLLRAIETSEVRPLGSPNAHAVDVRIIAATDANLHAQQQRGQFKLPLWHRLAGDEILIAPLRARRDDIARLWVHFLREHLGVHEITWLSPRDDHQPWISTSFMARLLEHDWPGNVRELRNLAARFVSESLRQGDHRAPHGFELSLGAKPPQHTASTAPRAVPPGDAEATLVPGLDSSADGAVPSNHTEPRMRPVDIDNAQLLAALRANAWNPGATARALQLSRTTLYRLIEQCPDVRKAKDVERAEILAASERCGADASRMAAELQVSERGLILRMRELGMG